MKLEKLRRTQADEEQQHEPKTREVADKPPMSLQPKWVRIFPLFSPYAILGEDTEDRMVLKSSAVPPITSGREEWTDENRFAYGVG